MIENSEFCVSCGFDMFVDRHHIILKSKGGKGDKENMVFLCPNCHRAAHMGILTVRALQIKKERAKIKRTAIMKNHAREFAFKIIECEGDEESERRLIAAKAREKVARNSPVAGL